jgi:DNA-binding NtrC family response regulator
MASNHRLTFLIVESEPAQGLSTRKLLIETAKHNVITAYSGKEGLRMLERFPNVDAVAVDVTLEDIPCEQFVKEVEKRNPRVKIVGLSPNKVRFDCGQAKLVDSHDPAELLKLLESLGGPTKI